MKIQLAAYGILSLLAAVPIIAEAQIYKCVDARTKATTYSSSPYMAGDERVVSVVENAIGDDGAMRREAARREGAQGAPHQPGPNLQAPVSRPKFADQKARLTDECARGLSGACSRLRTLTAASGAGPENADQKERLANECARGIRGSCASLRAVTGVPEPKVTVSTCNGTSNGYQTNTICVSR